MTRRLHRWRVRATTEADALRLAGETCLKGWGCVADTDDVLRSARHRIGAP